MSKTPYPPFAPSYTVVDSVGGYKRNCLVIEFLSLGDLTPVQAALIQEQLEATVDKCHRAISTVESAQVVTSDRFDPILRKGLRLS